MSPSDRSAPAPGIAAVSDRYEIEHAVGHGGMADVYRGRDLVLERAVAVKILRDATADPGARERFVAEARTLAGLSHPGLVTVLDAGTDEQRLYLVMELVEEPTLADACRPDGLGAGPVATIGAQVADALAYVHSRGIVHRDVKPANVLLSTDGRVLLADFGIARLTENAAALTAAGSVIGTAAYLAPEQLRGGPISPALDVYSLGLVLIEALTGRPAYPGGGIETAAARLSAPPAIPAGLPAGFSAVLRRMVSLRPEDRPALAEVAAVLRAVGDGTVTVRPPAGPPAAHPATRMLPTPPAAGPPVRRKQARRPFVVAGVVLAAVVLLVVGLVLLANRDGAPAEPRIPPNLPAEISEDLRDLHEAVG